MKVPIAVLQFLSLLSAVSASSSNRWHLHPRHAHTHSLNTRGLLSHTIDFCAPNILDPRLRPSMKANKFSTNINRDAFITIDENGGLTLDGKPFRFISLAEPNLFKSNKFQIEDALKTFASFGSPVTRPYVISIASVNVQAKDAHIQGWDNATNSWIFNPTVFETTDLVLSTARERGVRLLIPLVNANYNNEGNNWAGNWNDMIRLRYGFASYNETIASGIDFWSDPTMVDAFKTFLSQLLERENSVNGIRYGSDATVMAWETGNELTEINNQNVTKGIVPGNWTVAIAEHIKSLAPNTLVLDGTFSRQDATENGWAIEALESPAVDMFSFHYYGDGDRLRTARDTAYVKQYKKAFIVGESGFFSAGAKYPEFFDWVQGNDTDGALIWSLREHSVKGGFVVHNEDAKDWSYHAPGWTERDANFDPKEQAVITSVRDYSFSINGDRPWAYPVPEAPSILSFNTADNTTGLIWQGSTYAQDYQLLKLTDRASSSTSTIKSYPGSCWTVVADNMLDNLAEGKVLWNLTETQTAGSFALRAFSVDGNPGPLSSIFNL
ncbi:glycoside hydrolase family 5 protein [Atractiella rhizophila]|nr:glycoside hydrolase family 5 protein [Atractiella rhizophila]